MATFSWDTGSYGGSAYVLNAGYGWYNSSSESFPSATLAANGKRPILVSLVEFLGGGGGGKVAKFDSGGGYRTSGLVADPSSFVFQVLATGSGTTTFLRNTAASGSIISTFDGTTLSGQLPGRITYAQVPSAPTITSLTQTSPTEASVVWSAPSSDGDSAITGYRVDWSTESDFSADVHTSSVGNVLTTSLTGIDPGVDIHVRVAAINAVASSAGTTSQYSSTEDLTMIADIGDIDGWASYGTDPSGVDPLVTGGLRRGTITPLGDGTTGLIREYTCTGSGGPTTSGARGIQRTFTGLTVGETYRLNGAALAMTATTPDTTKYRWAVVGIGAGDWGTISDDVTPADLAEYEFEATSTSHTVQIQADAASWSTDGYFERVGFYKITLKLVPNPTDYFCQDLDLESSLANHYTVACATVGAAWWVGADNVTRFRQAADTPALVATLSDVDTPGTIPFIDVAATHSTKGIANILTVTNYGRPDDETVTFTNDDSIAAWGPREARLSLSLYDADTYLQDRADEVFTRMANPHRQVTSVTFNAQQNLALVAQFEIQARVAVTFEGVTETLRIVGVHHTITGGEWLIDLDLAVWGYPEATSSGVGISSLLSSSVSQSAFDAVKSDVTALETGYRLNQIVKFTSSGSFSKASYSWLRAIRVRVQAGGGSGAGCQAAGGGAYSAGTGGGGGEYAESFITDIAGLASSVTVTVGAGGAGSSGAEGNNGSDSSFGSIVIAKGGKRGSVKPSNTYATYFPGGAGGTGGTGDLLFAGGGGESGNGNSSLGGGGAGGHAHLGGGARSEASGSGGASLAGVTGGNYGGGGGGAFSSTGGAAKAGGDGGDGIVILELYA